MSRTSTKVVKPAAVRTRRVDNELHINTTRWSSDFAGYGSDNHPGRVYKNAKGEIMLKIGCQRHSLARWREKGAAIFQRFIEGPGNGAVRKPKPVTSFLRYVPKTANVGYRQVTLTKGQRLKIAKQQRENYVQSYNDAVARKKFAVATLKRVIKIAETKGATLPKPPRPLRAPIQPLTILATANDVAHIDAAGTN